MLLAYSSRQPFKAFTLSANHFRTLTPSIPGWKIESLPIQTPDPAEPNIVTYLVTVPPSPASLPKPAVLPVSHQHFQVRLVHGYNMPMCMKIKGYSVEPVSDSMQPAPDGQSSNYRIQTWKLTSDAGEVSYWLTTMIQADDFSPSGQDICRMAFPRVDIPDDPNWTPDGISMEDLRHPLQAMHRWYRTRWNAARMDLLTFLRLKQPAWASHEQLSYVTRDFPAKDDNPDPARRIAELQMVHIRMLALFQDWRRTQASHQSRQ